MIVFVWTCAAGSVALGAGYMAAAGAPARYIWINVAALIVGIAVGTLLSRVASRRLADATTATTAVLMLGTALFGVHIDGVSRWVSIGGLSFQPSVIMMPVSMVLFAEQRSWPATVAMLIAAAGLAMQPDRAMAGTMAAGALALWLHRREAQATLLLVGATAAFAWCLWSPDAVPPVMFVEHVVASAFAFSAGIGSAVVTGLLLMLLPVAGGFISGRHDRGTLALFGVTWMAIIAFALVGKIPDTARRLRQQRHSRVLHERRVRIQARSHPLNALLKRGPDAARASQAPSSGGLIQAECPREAPASCRGPVITGGLGGESETDDADRGTDNAPADADVGLEEIS